MIQFKSPWTGPGVKGGAVVWVEKYRVTIMKKTLGVSGVPVNYDRLIRQCCWMAYALQVENNVRGIPSKKSGSLTADRCAGWLETPPKGGAQLCGKTQHSPRPWHALWDLPLRCSRETDLSGSFLDGAHQVIQGPYTWSTMQTKLFRLKNLTTSLIRFHLSPHHMSSHMLKTKKNKRIGKKIRCFSRTRL